MHFEPIVEDEFDRTSRIRGLRIVHGDAFTEWGISTIARTDYDHDRVMTEINDFFSKLPVERQAMIYDVYERISDAFHSTVDLNRIFQQVRRLVTELYSHLNFNDFLDYVKHVSRVVIPDEIKTVYGPDAPESPLTYLRHEYKELMAFSLYMKPMFPVWGEYTLQIKDQLGAEFKEYSALKLLEGSAGKNNEAYDRLYAYVATNVAKTSTNIEAILGGLSSEEKPDWLTAIVIVRRLSSWQPTFVGENRKVENLVADIYNYMRSKVENMAKNFGGRVKNKPLRARSEHPEEGSSVPEMYKMKEPVSEGDILIHEAYCDNPEHILRRLDETIPIEYLNESLEYFKRYGYDDLKVCQKIIVQYTMNRQISARVFSQLSYRSVVHLLAVTQAALRHWNLPWLAALLSAEAYALPADRVTGELRLDLSEDRIIKLLGLNPHFIQPKNLKRDNVTNRAKSNVSINAINIIATDIDAVGWRHRHAKQAWVQAATRNCNEGSAPSDIKDQLADLIIFTQSPKA